MFEGIYQVFEIETTLDFCKYKGKTVKEVFVSDPGCIEWALSENAFFRVNESIFKLFQIIRPDFKFSEKARKFTEEYLKDNMLEFIREYR